GRRSRQSLAGLAPPPPRASLVQRTPADACSCPSSYPHASRAERRRLEVLVPLFAVDQRSSPTRPVATPRQLPRRQSFSLRLEPRDGLGPLQPPVLEPEASQPLQRTPRAAWRESRARR